jgi:multiple sugar transport system permease protein
MFVIWTFNSFPVIYVITRGGPIHSTDTLVTYIYKIAFQYGLFEEATALATITFVLILAFSLPYARQYFRAEEGQ